MPLVLDVVRHWGRLLRGSCKLYDAEWEDISYYYTTMRRTILELTIDDCLDIADLLRARISVLERKHATDDDIGNLRDMQRKFRALSKTDPLEKYVIVRATE